MPLSHICVARCCSVLQCHTHMCCRVLQCVLVSHTSDVCLSHTYVLQFVAVCCSVLQCVAVFKCIDKWMPSYMHAWRIVSQCVAVCHSVLQCCIV